MGNRARHGCDGGEAYGRSSLRRGQLHADGKVAILTSACARWHANQDDICHGWDVAYTLMLATPPTTAAGARFCNTNALSGPSLEIPF
jgi:hypothetical protein